MTIKRSTDSTRSGIRGPALILISALYNHEVLVNQFIVLDESLTEAFLFWEFCFTVPGLSIYKQGYLAQSEYNALAE